MAVTKQKGFTLIEIIIYFFLCAIAMGIIVSMFALAQRTQRQTYGQYLVGGSLSSTIRLIQKELQATALASIRAYPTDGTGEPGFSCVSAYDADGKFALNGYGAPKWQKHVFYTLDDTALVRKSKVFANPDTALPLASAELPSAVQGESRAVMSGLLQANKAVKDIQAASPFGGLELSFVRRANGVDSYSQVNPSESKDYDQHTRLVQVTLRTLEDRSQPDYSQITFRVCPRY